MRAAKDLAIARVITMTGCRTLSRKGPRAIEHTQTRLRGLTAEASYWAFVFLGFRVPMKVACRI